MTAFFYNVKQLAAQEIKNVILSAKKSEVTYFFQLMY